MNTATIILLYAGIFLAGAIVTQLTGNGHRPFHEGVLAWLFLPLGMVTCFISMLSEGPAGFKQSLHEFGETLFNTEPKSADAKAAKKGHRISEDLA